MNYVYIMLAAVFMCFALVVLVGAPYLPTKKEQIDQLLKLMGNVKGKRAVDLGAGSGGVVLALAAKGAIVTAYEINPFLAMFIWLRAKRAGLSVKVVWGSYWNSNLHNYDLAYIFPVQKDMKKLELKADKEFKQGSLLVVYAFKLLTKPASAKLGPMTKYKY